MSCSLARDQKISYRKVDPSRPNWSKTYTEGPISESNTANFSFTTDKLKDDLPVAEIDPATGVSYGTRYEWQVAVYEHGEVAPTGWKGGYFYVKYVPPTLSCKVSPERGTAPLVTKITPIGNCPPPYTVVINGGSPISKNKEFWHTFESAGKYTVDISSSLDIPSCKTQCVTSVAEPGTVTGGEVAP